MKTMTSRTVHRGCSVRSSESIDDFAHDDEEKKVKKRLLGIIRFDDRQVFHGRNLKSLIQKKLSEVFLSYS